MRCFPRCLLIALIVLAVTATSGCQVARSIRGAAGIDSNGLSSANLASDLRSFESTFEETVISTADRIRSDSRDQTARDSAIRWKAIALRQIRDHVFEDEPIDGLLETWAYTVRLNDYLSGQQAGRYFGPHIDEARVVGTESLAAMTKLARAYLPPDDFDRVEAYIQEYARSRPMRGFFDDSAAAQEPVSYQRLSAVTQLVKLPLSPLLAFRSVNKTADSIAQFNNIAERFTDVAEDLPRDLRWQTEIMVDGVLRSDQITTALLSMQRVSDSAERISVVTERLPEETAAAVRSALAEVEASEPMLRGLLTETRTVAIQLRETIEQATVTTTEANRLAEQLERTAAAWNETAKSGSLLLEGVERLAKPSGNPSASNSRAFDIEDYRRTAEELRLATEEARRLLDQVERVQSPPVVQDLEQAISNSTQTADARARGLVDHAYQRGLQLLLLIAALGLGLMVVGIVGVGLLMRMRRPKAG